MHNLSLKIWETASILRGYIQIKDTDFILLILSLYKDDYLDDLQLVPSEKRQEYIVTMVSKNEDYKLIINEYISTFLQLPEKIIDSLIDSIFDIDKEELKKNFPEIFENILFIISENSGKISGEFIQPKELTEVIHNLLELPSNSKLYNPFAGVASFALGLEKGQKYFGQELNNKTWALGKLRLKAHNIDDLNYVKADSITQWIEPKVENEKFEAILSFPPFKLKLNKELSRSTFNTAIATADHYLIKKGLESLKKNGQLITVVPNAFLFESGNTKKLRKYLVENNLLDTVIGFPGGLLFNTAIPFSVIILRKSKESNESIRFIDATGFLKTNEKTKKTKFDVKDLLIQIKTENKRVLKLVPSKKIIKPDYNLIVSRYVFEKIEVPQEYESYLTPLAKILFSVPQMSSDTKSAKLIDYSILSDNILNQKISSQDIPIKDIKGFHKKLDLSLGFQDILLLNRAGSRFKPTFLNIENDDELYIHHTISAFHLLSFDKNISKTFLGLELTKPYVESQKKRFFQGTTFSSISPKNLNSIQIILYPYLEQLKKEKEYLASYQDEKFSIVNDAIAEYNAKVADENSFIRHQISGTLKNLRSSFRHINTIFESLNKIYPGLKESKSNDLIDTNLGDFLFRAERDIQSLTRVVNQSGNDIALNDIHLEHIDFIAFVKEYVEELKERNANNYIVEIDIDEKALESNPFEYFLVECDKDLIRKMFDNIVENAEKHGFKGKSNIENKIQFYFMYDFEDLRLQLDISNTGNAMPKDLSHEAYIRKGSSKGDAAGDGIGGWLVNEVMRIHEGKFEFTDETGSEGIYSEFVTSIELTFPIIPVI